MKSKLFTDCVNQPAVEFDWSEGFAETWDIISPVPAWSIKECRQYLDDNGDEFDSEDVEELRDQCELIRDVDSDCPMHGYYYPLPHFDIANAGFSTIHEAQHAIRQTACVLVQLNGGWDGYALALQGGGMDLSWDICEAHILLGYYPPVEYCDLPRYSGIKYTKRVKRIVNACLESTKIAQRWATYRNRDLRQYRSQLIQERGAA